MQSDQPGDSRQLKKHLPYFKWYPSDADTDANFRAMDDADIGFYVRCLNHAWINGGVPADPTERARCLRTRKSVADRRWIRVGKCFVAHPSDATLCVNPRQESERQLALQKSQVGVESANRRWVPNASALARAGYASVSDSEVLNAATETKTVSRAREGPTEEEKRFWIAKTMLEFPGARILGKLPDERVIEQCYELARGDLEALARAFRSLHLTGQKPNISWAWFPKVLPYHLDRSKAAAT